MHIDDLWRSGGSLKITRDVLLKDIEQHTAAGGKIFVGCDSNMIGEMCTFAHAMNQLEPADAIIAKQAKSK